MIRCLSSCLEAGGFDVLAAGVAVVISVFHVLPSDILANDFQPELLLLTLVGAIKNIRANLPELVGRGCEVLLASGSASG